MTAGIKDSAAWRWLNKTVLDSRPLNDMEDMENARDGKRRTLGSLGRPR